MFINLDDHRPEPPSIDTPMSRREGVILSMFLHALVLAALLFGPQLPFVQRWQEDAARARQEAIRRALELQQQQQQQDQARFVFVQPRLDMQTGPPTERAPLADIDRSARSPEPRPNATNPQPYSEGNSLEFVERTEAREAAKGRGPAPEPSDTRAAEEAAARALAEAAQAQASAAAATPEPADGGLDMRERDTASLPRGADGSLTQSARSGATAAARPPGGALGQALRNLERYVQDEALNNPDGGNSPFGPYIQFDTKGVEFGPWIRRFIAQIKRNWLIPEAAMLLKGHVAITFNVHKDGRITDITVAKPSGIDSFDRAAANSLAWSNPTQPLPPEYPSPTAFFTVTFFYNEQPPSQ
jgi:TonB family protein